MPEQVQDFYPTPSTISTCMYYTGVDPRNMEKVYVPKNPHEKAMQRALIQYKRPENYDLVKEALLKCGRQDLIGFGKECLIPPRKMNKEDGKVKKVNNLKKKNIEKQSNSSKIKKEQKTNRSNNKQNQRFGKNIDNKKTGRSTSRKNDSSSRRNKKQ